jgi:hypothetical protein
MPGFDLKRGEMVTSLAALAEGCQWFENRKVRTWSRQKVRRMLADLVETEFVEVISDTYGTHLKVCKYDAYQDARNYNSDRHGTTSKQRRNNVETTCDTYNKDKNVKNGKNGKNTPHGGNGELFDPQPQPPEQEPDTKAPDAALQATFDEARKAYPGITRGMPTEWANFKKKHKADYRQAAAELLPAIEAQAASRERKKQVGDFCPDWPHFATWINNRRWEDQVPVAPAAKRKPLATW